MDYRRLAWTSLIALLLGVLLAPWPTELPPTEAHRSSSLDTIERWSPPSSKYPLSETPSSASLRSPEGGRAEPLLRTAEMPDAAPAPEPPLGQGWLSGHVVDGNGLPVGGAVLHLHGPNGTEAHRIADDGEFHIPVTEGRWQVEAGWFDGEDEWRSRGSMAMIRPGATSHMALEILLDDAGHAVHAGLREALGIGFEVLRDDGPLLKGDVLVEVGGLILTELQPEAVRAALRERPGESIEAVVLRPIEGGSYEELPVVLKAR